MNIHRSPHIFGPSELDREQNFLAVVEKGYLIPLALIETDRIQLFSFAHERIMN
jgi:hypothetical protein